MDANTVLTLPERTMSVLDAEVFMGLIKVLTGTAPSCVRLNGNQLEYAAAESECSQEVLVAALIAIGDVVLTSRQWCHWGKDVHECVLTVP